MKGRSDLAGHTWSLFARRIQRAIRATGIALLVAGIPSAGTAPSLVLARGVVAPVPAPAAQSTTYAPTFTVSGLVVPRGVSR